MKKLEFNKLTIALFLIGVLIGTLFLPILSPRAIYSERNEGKNLIIGTLTADASGGQNPIPFSVNLIEEEVEHAPPIDKKFTDHPPIHITLSFSSPSLYFDEHFTEVSGPPPWA
jgi:hypothetical protein